MRAVVVANGDTDAHDLAQVDAEDLLVAADGGAARLADVELQPRLLIGDLDSVEQATVDRLASSGTAVERHPADKQASDAELAVDRAVAMGAETILLVGALGGARLDHQLANLLLLADPARRGAGLRIVRGATSVRCLHGAQTATLRAGRGAIVSLLPVGGDAVGVRTTGLQWSLEGETLRMGRSRGLSNRVVASEASVSIEDGALLVVEIDQQEGSA